MENKCANNWLIEKKKKNSRGKTISAKIWHPFMNSKENISNPWIKKNFPRVSTKKSAENIEEDDEK